MAETEAPTNSRRRPMISCGQNTMSSCLPASLLKTDRRGDPPPLHVRAIARRCKARDLPMNYVPDFWSFGKPAPKATMFASKCRRAATCALRYMPAFQANALTLKPPRTERAENAFLERLVVRCPGGLVGHQVSIEGLASTFTDVVVRVALSDGAVQAIQADAGPALLHGCRRADLDGYRPNLFPSRRRAHPARHRSPAIRAGASSSRPQPVDAGEGHYGLHRRAQHHAGRGRPWLGSHPAGACRGGDCAQHHVRSSRDHSAEASPDRPRKQSAMDHRFRLWPLARSWLRRGAQGDRPASV